MIDFRFLVEQLLIEATIMPNSILDSTGFSSSEISKTTSTANLDSGDADILLNALTRKSAEELAYIYNRNPNLLYIADMLSFYADTLVKQHKKDPTLTAVANDVPTALTTAEMSLSAARAADQNAATLFKNKNKTAPAINLFAYVPISSYITSQWRLVQEKILKSSRDEKVFNDYLGAEKSKTVVKFVEENSGLDISKYETNQKDTVKKIQASDKDLAGTVLSIAENLAEDVTKLTPPIPYDKVKIEDLLKNVSVHAELLKSLKNLVLLAAKADKWARLKKFMAGLKTFSGGLGDVAKLGMAPGTR